MNRDHPDVGIESNDFALRTEETTINQKEQIWSECLNIIKGRVNSQSYKAWFEPIKPLKIGGEKVLHPGSKPVFL